MKKLTIAMWKEKLIIVLLLLVPLNVLAQVLTRRIQSADLNLIFKRHIEFNEKEVLLPLIDVDKVLSEDKIDESEGLPPRFGMACTVDFDLDNSGAWVTVEDGRIWKLRINSPFAKSLNLIFDRFHIPQGGELIIYSSNKNILYGPVTHDDINKYNKLSTDLIQSNSITIEYFEPDDQLYGSEIHIDKIIQGYKNFGDSGDCLDYNDINCSKGQPWWNASDAVAMVLIDQNQRWCSGSLLNNGCQDYTPSFLTAFHCIDNNPSNGVISENERNEAQTWLFRFQYKSPTCNGPDDYVTISGSTFRSAWNPSDFALLELSQRPTGQKNIKLAGWNRIDNAPSSSVGIHHPSGDVMKISFDNDAPVIEGYYGGSGANFYRVTWDDGVTEGGSSGSPLFDQNQRVVGQLTGGESACNKSDFRDWYGRIFSSWTGGGADTTRLSTWLTNNPMVETTNTIAIPYITLSGSDFVICTNPYVGINLVNAPPDVTHNIGWTVSPNLTIVSQGYSSLLVRYSGSQNGAATITANIGNNNPGTCPVVTPFTITVQAGPFSAGQVSVSGQAAVCSGYEYTYTANPFGGHRAGYTYSWTYPSGWYVAGQSANTIRLRVPQYDPNYGTVRASVNNGCGTSGYSGITVYPGYGCGGYLYSWYPNPTENQLTIEVVSESDGKPLNNGASVTYEAYIYDKNSKLVKYMKGNANHMVVDLSDLKPGQYFLNIIDANAMVRDQIIVK